MVSQWNKRLDRFSEASSMDPNGPGSVQQPFPLRQSQGNRLLFMKAPIWSIRPQDLPKQTFSAYCPTFAI